MLLYFSNVQVYPDDDVYRRVRISSRRFHDKVWQYSDAQQFLARAGWVEVRKTEELHLATCISCNLIHTFAASHTHTHMHTHTHAHTHTHTHTHTHQIDDFIVLPIGKTVDIPKRILDKHLE